MIFRNFAMCVFFWVSFGFHYFTILGETVFTWIVETEGQGWVLISWTRDLSRAARAATGTSVLEVGGNQGLLFQFRQIFNLLQIIYKGCSSEPFFYLPEEHLGQDVSDQEHLLLHSPSRPSCQSCCFQLLHHEGGQQIRDGNPYSRDTKVEGGCN